MPASGLIRPVSKANSVDLPLPLGPISAVVSPGRYGETDTIKHSFIAIGFENRIEPEHDWPRGKIII